MSSQDPAYRRFIAELKRRRVFRVVAMYGATAFVVIEAADVIFPAIPLPPWTVSLVVWLALLGLPIAAVLAWALEMTPEGVRRTAEAAPGELSEIIAAPAVRRWSSGLLALVGVTALLAGAWYAGRQSAPVGNADSVGVASASIAVLPFADMSPDMDQEYFSDGISEELLNLLAKIPGLQVAARTSSFFYKGKDVKLADLASELNVAHVLEGSVRKSGNEVRITAQLIKADDGFHVWSDTWDRSLDDIFAIQEEIAADVVKQLQVELLGAIPTVEETVPGAYALYLQARQLFGQRTVESMEHSAELYEQALALDPEYAAAWAGLARNYQYRAGQGLLSLPFGEGYQMAREAATRSLGLDPENAEAHALLGVIAELADYDLPGAAEHLGRALELEPANPFVLRMSAQFVRDLGRLEEDVAIMEYVVARDPVNASGHVGLGWDYRRARRLDESIASLRTALRLSPGFTNAHYAIAAALLQKGEPGAALEEIRKESNRAFRQVGLVMTYHALGRTAESDSALYELIEEHEQTHAFQIAFAMAFRGETDRAFEWLSKALHFKDPGLHEIVAESLFANIHDDPRWLPFLESIGKSPEQLAAIEFEVPQLE